jgi:hypothetical protein
MHALYSVMKVALFVLTATFPVDRAYRDIVAQEHAETAANELEHHHGSGQVHAFSALPQTNIQRVRV